MNSRLSIRPVLPVLKGVSLRLLLSLTQNLPGQLDTPNFNVENDEKPWENKKGDAGTASISVLPVVCFFCFQIIVIVQCLFLVFFSRGGFGAILMLKRCVDVWIGWCFVCGLQFLILSSFPFNPTNINIWLVVLIILKHMKVKWEGLSHILWKKNETTNQVFNNC